MFGSARHPTKAYTNIAAETRVSDADPHTLILMLFEGAIAAVAAAALHMQRKEIARKGQSISHAIDIILNGLKASLDHKAGGKLARQLADLYDYMGDRLLQANLRNDQAALEEVRQLLQQLSGAWASIGNKPQAAAAQTDAPAQARSPAMHYGSA